MQQKPERGLSNVVDRLAERKMSPSWQHLYLPILLFLLSLTRIHTTGVPSPLTFKDSSITDVKGVVLKGESYVEKVELLKPVDLELDCTWTGNLHKLPNITGYWEKDGQEIANTHQSVQLENEQYNLKRMFRINEDTLGNYSCIFDGQAKIDFILAAPEMGDMRDKPIVSYVGDSVVINCKMEKTPPNIWLWYRANGTEQELINTTVGRYRINNEGKYSKLTILNLTEDDTGTYLCCAGFDIRVSRGQVEMRVITFLEPLKPFIVIVSEVLLLVIIILLYEKKSCSKQRSSVTGNGMPSDQTNQMTEDCNGMEESTTMRQRKV